MYNDLLTIGGVTLHGYGLMIGIGVIMAYLTAERRAKKNGIDADHLIMMMVYAIVFGLLGAKLLFYITAFDDIIKNPKLLLDIQYGFVVYGGIIGGAAAVYIYTRVKKINFLSYFDLIMPSVALAQGFGRIGCLLAGCCYGMETDSPISIVFSHSNFAPNGVHLVPTQIFSSVLDFANCAILLLIYKNKKSEGTVGAWYLIFYSIGRFVLEFFRGDLERGSVGTLSTSQFISLFIGVVGIGLLIWFTKRGKKAGQE